MSENAKLDNFQIEKLQSPRERFNNAIKLMERNGTDRFTMESYRTIVDLVANHPRPEVRTQPTWHSSRIQGLIDEIDRLGKEEGVTESLRRRKRLLSYQKIFEENPAFTIYRLPQVQFTPDLIPGIFLSISVDLEFASYFPYGSGDVAHTSRYQGPFDFVDFADLLFIDKPARFRRDGKGPKWELDLSLPDGRPNVAYGQVFIVPGTEFYPGNIYSIDPIFGDVDENLVRTFDPDTLKGVIPITDELKGRVIETYKAALAYSQGKKVFDWFQLRRPPVKNYDGKIKYPERIADLLLYVRQGIVVRKKDRFSKLRGIGKRPGLSGSKPSDKLLGGGSRGI